MGFAQQADTNRSILREGVWVEKDLCLSLKPLLVIDDRLVLKACVLVEEVIVADSKRGGVAGVVVELFEARLDLVSERNFGEVAEGDSVLFLYPGGHLLGAVIFKPSVRIGDLGPVVSVDNINFLCFGVGKHLFLFLFLWSGGAETR